MTAGLPSLGLKQAIARRTLVSLSETAQENAMLRKLIPTLALLTAAASAPGADVTYTNDIQPLFKERCAKCHGAESPDLETFKRSEEKFISQNIGPRMSTYTELISYIGWPETGAIMRRLDDGKASPGGKPGNMYRNLGPDDAARQKNLAIVKAWVGEGGWNLNRWHARADVPAITKEQLDKLQLKY